SVCLEPCPSYPRDWSLRPSRCPEIKKFKKCQKRAIFGPKSFTAFSAEASRSGWDTRVGGFAAHNMHMLLPKTHPVWFRFSEAANGQIEKRAIFTFFQKVKNRFLQVTKVDRSPQRREILGPNLSHQHITKMRCSH